MPCLIRNGCTQSRLIAVGMTKNYVRFDVLPTFTVEDAGGGIKYNYYDPI